MFESLRRSLTELSERITKTELKEERIDAILWDFKLKLAENDVALSTADQICEGIKQRLVGTRVARLHDVKRLVDKTLKESLLEVLKAEENVNLLDKVKDKKGSKEPAVLVFVGINGTGKTTTLAKVAKLLIKHGFSVVLACSDTYRPGAIEQLEAHAKRLGVKMIKRPYGSDPASVAFDAISHARAHEMNAVLVDTAGRIETNRNLMEEMRKIVKVAEPDLTVFVGDALTGNDAVDQAEEFNRFVRIDGSILTKIDADAKGGSAVSITNVTGKPILYLGNGQGYDDLMAFEAEEFVKGLIGG